MGSFFESLGRVLWACSRCAERPRLKHRLFGLRPRTGESFTGGRGMNASDKFEVDSHGRTDVPGVLAAGDCIATVPYSVSKLGFTERVWPPD